MRPPSSLYRYRGGKDGKAHRLALIRQASAVRPGRRLRLRAAGANEGTLALGQPVDDQFVAVLEEPEDKLVGQRGVECDRDPMTLVEVVSGSHGRVLGAERFGQRRLA